MSEGIREGRQEGERREEGRKWGGGEWRPVYGG